MERESGDCSRVWGRKGSVMLKNKGQREVDYKNIYIFKTTFKCMNFLSVFIVNTQSRHEPLTSCLNVQ